jgi:hypothetical protein
MFKLLRFGAMAMVLFAMADANAAFHLFRIDQIYSNADGSVQFVVLREAGGANGESFWQGVTLTSTHAGVSKTFTFPSNLPDTNTAGRRVLVATQDFADLGLVTPNFVMPKGFLATDGGTLSYAGGVDQVTYTALPTDGVNAIDRSGAMVHNLATNYAGATGSVTAPAAGFTPTVGLWWNPDESGSGYNFDVKHGVLVVTIFTYDGLGHSEWYLAAGPLTDNGTKFSATLDKYRGGQCVGAGCVYRNPGPPAGNDGSISITFTSATSATVILPGRVTTIQPQVF